MKNVNHMIKALEQGKKNLDTDIRLIKAAKKRHAELVRKSASETADEAIAHFCFLLKDDCNVEMLEASFNMPRICHTFALVNGTRRELLSDEQMYIDELRTQFVNRGLSAKCEYIRFMSQLKVTLSMADFLNGIKKETDNEA